MISLIPYAEAATNVAAQAAAKGFVAKINDAILFPLITLMMAIAFLVFLYGAFEYVRNATSESGRETGRQHLFYGVIGMLVMLSAMAILSIAAGTFGLSDVLDDANSPVSSSPFAPTTSLIPPSRPADLTQCYSLSPDCGPSQNPDVYRAFYEEYRTTGGAALGSTNLMVIQDYFESSGGDADRALDSAAELYANDNLSTETYTRLVNEINKINETNEFTNMVNDAINSDDAFIDATNDSIDTGTSWVR